MSDNEERPGESMAERLGRKLFLLIFLFVIVAIVAAMVALCFGVTGIGMEGLRDEFTVYPAEGVIVVAMDPEQLAALCIAIVMSGMMAGN